MTLTLVPKGPLESLVLQNKRKICFHFEQHYSVTIFGHVINKEIHNNRSAYPLPLILSVEL